MTSKSKLENISAPLPKFAGTSAALKQIPLGWNRGLRIADALGHAVASPRHGRPQSSLRRLRTLVCDAGHPRLAAHSERKAWMARKSGVPDFRLIERDRKSETSDLRASSPAMTWRGQSATRTPRKAENGSNRRERALVPRRLNLGTEIARNRDATLERLHGERRDDVDDDVDDGRCRERFEDLEREFLHRTCACGELHQTDGERNRAVLDGVEKLRRQRR